MLSIFLPYAKYLKNKESRFNFKRPLIGTKSIPNIVKKRFEQFVSKETNLFFNRFNLDVDLLTINPSTWLDNQCYIKGQGSSLESSNLYCGYILTSFSC